MIHVRNISKSFKTVRALDNVNLHIPKGTIKALLGPNGAGKTTLVRMMATLLRQDAGTITINGLDTLNDTKKVRNIIGLAGQYAAVDEDLSGYENLVMFGRLYHLSRHHAQQRARELLKEFHLEDAGNRLLKTYSGGMRRRLDLMASLIVDPPVLFLDEPTTGLDPASRQNLWETIRALVKKGTTVLLTTQYLEEADALADSIAVINRGKIIADGTADELKTQSGGDVLEVTIADASNIAATTHILETVAHQSVQCDAQRLHFRAPVNGGADVLIDVIRNMDDKKIHIRDIQLRRPTLDDVFLALVGTHTDDARADDTLTPSKQ